jgi:hypothetical protein
MTEKKPKYKFDGKYNAHYVRAWKEGRGRDAEIAVQVWWAKDKPEGEPDGDWGMPGVLPVSAAIAQAVLNTQGDLKK